MPLVVIRLHLILAIPVCVKLAIWESYHKILILVHDLLTASTRYVDSIRIKDILRNQRKFG